MSKSLTKRDIERIVEKSTCCDVGTLTDEVINKLNLKCDSCSIVLWYDRIPHIEKHVKDFQGVQNVNEIVMTIPQVIESPDYIAKHPSKNSIEYIKRIDDLVLVAVRIKPKGPIAVRTVFPITEEQLQRYIDGGTVTQVDECNGK